MPDAEWQWDETLFAGTAPYYVRGRLPYPAGMPQALADALGLDGTGRLIDVGCGPGTIALQIAHLFAEVVGVDPDAGMLAEAERQADLYGVANARWVRSRAEELAGNVGAFRVATFSRSFHWMDRDRVASIMLRMLEPGGRGAFVQMSFQDNALAIDVATPHPLPPTEAIGELVRSYLGPDRRAGKGIRNTSPGGETVVLERAGFQPPMLVRVPSDAVLERSTDDQVAHVFSQSQSAPHLFGERLAEFEADLRGLLAQVSPTGLFSERTIDTELRIWRTPIA